MHTVYWRTALLEDVSFTVRAQVDKASLAPAFSSTSSYAALKIFYVSKSFKQLVDGANQPKWSKNQKLIFPKVV